MDLPVFWLLLRAPRQHDLRAGLRRPRRVGHQLLVFATGLLATAAAYALGKAAFQERAGLWAAAAFYTTPLVGWLSATAYVDLPVTLFTLAAILALLEWRTSQRPGWLAAAGALAGAAFGTKLTALSLVAAVLAVLAVFLFADRGRSLFRKAAAFLVFLLPLAAVALPWYAIVFAFTGSRSFRSSTRSSGPGWDAQHESERRDVRHRRRLSRSWASLRP